MERSFTDDFWRIKKSVKFMPIHLRNPSQIFMLISCLAVTPVVVSDGPATEISLETILFDAQTPQAAVYKVQPKDTLMKIARKFHTTIDLIKKRNHLDSDFIRDGEKLSIWTGRFNIVVDKSDNTLTLQNDDRVIKVYPVSTGKESTSTPTGEFTIKDRLVDPVWFHHGIVVPPGTPENFLGTRWLGFDRPKYGIHGTVEPEFIGKSVSGGCVRMRNEDVEELYMLIPEGTKVLIKD